MKNKNIKLALASLLFLITIKLTAQETVTIPLSEPTKEGLLKMGIINGSITIKGSNTEEVIVKGIKRENGDNHHKRRNSKSISRERFLNIPFFSPSARCDSSLGNARNEKPRRRTPHSPSTSAHEHPAHQERPALR